MKSTTGLTGLGSRIGSERWLHLLRSGIRQDHEVDRVLLRQGDAGSHVFALTRGLVKVTRLEPDGTELFLAARGPGEVLGEISAVDRGPRSATVTTVRPSTTFMLPTAEFLRLVAELDLYEHLMAHVVQRLREGEDIRAELAALPLRQRLARTLLRLAGELGTPDARTAVIDVGISQQELARAVGASRSPVAAELAQFRSLGIVRTGPRHLVIRDVSTLAAIAAGSGSSRDASSAS